MHYPEFPAAGLCTSIGVAEARCKRAGMHWTVANVAQSLHCAAASCAV